MSNFVFEGFEPPNTTLVPNVFFDEWMADLTGDELRVMLIMFRHAPTPRHRLPFVRIQLACPSLSEQALRHILMELVTGGYLLHPERTTYSLPFSQEVQDDPRWDLSEEDDECEQVVIRAPERERAVSEERLKKRREEQKVKFHRQRAKDMGLPSSLTPRQWLQTLDDFQWQCAYCRIQAYKILEHFVPLCLGGGTTASNCLPACEICHAYKRDRHPSTLLDHEQLGPAIERLQAYLAGREEEAGR